ncbi:MAG: DUF4167 domain-containing protein [Pseudomonadota bacterium]
MNNRQAGRRRGRGGQRQGGNPGRPDNGNRIDNRARGNAAQLLEKYKNLAQDSQRSGDRVATEYYLQFADHYFRVLAESRARMEDGGQPRRNRDDEDDAEGVEDFGFEGDLGSPAHYNSPPQISDDRDEPQRDSRPRRDRDGNGDRDDRPRQRDDQSREARPRRDRETSSDDRPRRDRDAPSDAAEAPRPRRDREASNDVGEDRPRREPRTYTRDPVVAREPAPEPRDERPVPANDEPRRRGRPRREVAPEAEQGGGLDAAMLPPAIGGEAKPVAEAAAEDRPRRGRPRRVRNDDEAVPPAA